MYKLSGRGCMQPANSQPEARYFHIEGYMQMKLNTSQTYSYFIKQNSNSSIIKMSTHKSPEKSDPKNFTNCN